MSMQLKLKKAEGASIVALLKPYLHSSPEVLSGAIGYRQIHSVLMINQLLECRQLLLLLILLLFFNFFSPASTKPAGLKIVKL